MLTLHVDFFSSGKIEGWTNAILIGSKAVIIKTACGLSKDITKAVNVIRPDVNEQYKLDAEQAIGFNVNLFDLFNNRIRAFDIYVDGFKAWSSSNQLAKLERGSNDQKNRFFEIGSKRIIILYDKDSWLDEISGKLHSWNINQFNKGLNNGVALSFLDLETFRQKTNDMDFSNSNNIFIIDRSAVREAVVLNNIISSYPIFIMEKNIDLSLDYSGVLSSVFYMNDFINGIEVTATVLRVIIDTITCFSELFFDSDNGSLLYVHGDISDAMAKVIRTINMEKLTFKGCIVLSKNKIVRLSDFNKDKDAIFINSTLLKNTFDIIDSDSDKFLKECLKRGIKIKSLEEGELE
jgi:hypothetical protein